MKKFMLFFMFLSFGVLFAHASFYAKVAKIYKSSNCWFIVVAVWDDNGTNDNPTDDFQVGSAVVRYCPPRTNETMDSNSENPLEINTDIREVEQLENINILDFAKTNQLKVIPTLTTSNNITVDFGDNSYETVFVSNEMGYVKKIDGNFTGQMKLNISLPAGMFTIVAFSEKNKYKATGKLIVQ